MTLLQRLAAFITVVGADIKARPPVVPSPNYNSVAGLLSGRTTPCTVIVAADETTLDSSGNPQRVTYWYDGTTLFYPALARADGSTTVAGSEGLGTLPAVADLASLLATPTVYRLTLVPMTADPANSGNTGFYVKEAGVNGKIHQLATNPIN